MKGPLDGQVVVVAGASSGMGTAIARAVVGAGAAVGLLARRADLLGRLADQLAEVHPGARCLVVPADASDPAATTGALLQAADRFGRIDAVVNAVGANIPARALPELTPESWRGMVAGNLDAAFNLTRAAVPLLRLGESRILIHIASVAARRADRSGLAYQATKAGVVAMAHATMEEERGNGLRVTAILPGMTDTPLLERRPTPPTEAMRRAALQPEDIAAACLFVLTLPPRAHVAEIVLQPAQG